jgi:hypothetical protein
MRRCSRSTRTATTSSAIQPRLDKRYAIVLGDRPQRRSVHRRDHPTHRHRHVQFVVGLAQHDIIAPSCGTTRLGDYISRPSDDTRSTIPRSVVGQSAER